MGGLSLPDFSEEEPEAEQVEGPTASMKEQGFESRSLPQGSSWPPGGDVERWPHSPCLSTRGALVGAAQSQNPPHSPKSSQLPSLPVAYDFCRLSSREGLGDLE